MIDGVGEQRFDETQIVHDLGRFGEQFRDPSPRLAVLRELKPGGHDRKRGLARSHSGDPLAFAHRGRQFFPLPLDELGLVVEQVELRGAAVHEEVDDPPGARREMRRPQRAAGGRRGARGHAVRGTRRRRVCARRPDQRGQRCRANSHRTAAEEVPPRESVNG
jgi:hypothetical protein